jgi:hypothetical protein
VERASRACLDGMYEEFDLLKSLFHGPITRTWERFMIPLKITRSSCLA